jgi:hypothetical protein
LFERHQLGDASCGRVEVASGFDVAEFGGGDDGFATNEHFLHLRAAAGVGKDVSACAVADAKTFCFRFFSATLFLSSVV